MTYNIDNQALIALTLSCLAAATAIAILIIYARRIILVVRNARRQADDTNQVFGLSPASIIVYAYENPDGVAALLPSLLSQDYDGGFEVIVVNDGNDEATDSLLRELEATHKNLYHTFTPHDTRNVSRKKLAITLGIKAARYESIVLVTADSRITSQRWLEKMARHFNDNEKDIVIGYAFPDLDNVANTPSRGEVQDWLIDIVHYLQLHSTDTPIEVTATISPTAAACFQEQGILAVAQPQLRRRRCIHPSVRHSAQRCGGAVARKPCEHFIHQSA